MTPRSIKPLKRPPLLHVSVQESLRAYVEDNDLKPGAPLPPEGVLAMQLGVSRNSVREGIKALESLGVLETRRGIPITLAVLLLELGEQAGLRMAGVAFPGHFLVKCRVGLGEVVLDPFTCEALSPARLDELLAVYREGSGLPDDLELPLEFFLRAATKRQILARMLRNLKEVHRAARDWVRLLAVQQRLVVLLPDEPAERRDRGLAYEALGAHADAAEDLAFYLARCGEAADAPSLRERLAVLLAQRSPPLQ